MSDKYLIFSALLILSAAHVFGQSGGQFEITQSVIASGGGQQTTGGIFTLDATTGQTLAGESSSGGIFGIRGGFWLSSIAPSAAMVSVGGQVKTGGGGGIRNVIVTMTAPSGALRNAVSGTFGYFRFENVEVGGTYIFSVSSKRFTFNQPTQVRSVLEDIADLNFIADER